MRRVKYLVALLGAVSLFVATGCGESGPTIDPGGKLKDLKIVPTTPASGSAIADPVKELARLREQVSLNYARNNNIRADVTIYIKDMRNGAIESAKLDYWFQKPKSVAMLIKEHSKSAANGTKMVWMGGPKIAVKTKFIGFWVKTSLDEADDRLKDGRGDRISETTVERMMKTLLDPSAQLAIVGQGNFKGKPITQISLKSKYMLARVESERIAIDTTTYLPVVREMYEKGQLTYRMQLESIKLNVKEPKAFELE